MDLEIFSAIAKRTFFWNLNSEDVHQQWKDRDHLNEQESASDDGEDVVWSEKVKKIVWNQILVQMRKRHVKDNAHVPENDGKDTIKVDDRIGFTMNNLKISLMSVSYM